MQPYALKKRWLFIASLIFICPAVSQNIRNQGDLPGTLLWRISGNGLKQSSYLFGTMHLTDKRLFNFDDSVYHSIEKCEGMAMEINPDEMIAYILNKAFDEVLKGQKLRSVLPQKDYARFSSRLAKKFGKPAEEITTSDITREKNRWMADVLEKGEMSTFIDTYLYNLARKQGKWVGGIEDVADQAGILENNIDNSDIEYLLAGDVHSADSRKLLEEMISLYQRQDLQGISSFLSPEESNNMLMTRRNIKMARRMDSLSAIRTMFFAVGAAHLPGDSGVITLLRKQGFSVDPVFSSKKIKPENYSVKEVDIPWVNVEDKGLYTISMPGRAIPMRILGMVNMNFFFDIFNISGCYSMAFRSPGELRDKDSAMNELAKRLFTSKTIVPSKEITSNGIKGREFTQKIEGLNARLRIFLENRSIYVAAYFGLKKEKVYGHDANQFFNSLVLQKSTGVDTAANYVFTDLANAVGVSSPAILELNPEMTNNTKSWNVTTFVGNDNNSGAYVMFFIKKTNPGYTIQNDSLIYADLLERLKDSHQDVHLKTRETSGIYFTDIAGRQKENHTIYTRTASVIKNNRNFLLMMVGDSAKMYSPPLDNYFQSLTYLPYKRSEWKWYTSADKSVRAFLPGELHKVSEDFSNVNQSVCYDSATSISYFLATDTLKKYVWHKEEKSFWNTFLNDMGTDTSQVTVTEVVNGIYKGKEMLARQPESFNRYTRIRYLLMDSILYRLVATGEKELLFSKDCDSLFRSLQVLKGRQGNFITTPKTSLILEDLNAPDSDTRLQASIALRDAPFTTDDIPTLRQALTRNYLSPYDSAYSNHTAFRLAGCIARVLDSARTITPLSELRTNEILSIGKELTTRMYTNDTTAYYYELMPFVSLIASLKNPQLIKLLQEWVLFKGNFMKQNVAMKLLNNNENVPAHIMDTLASDPNFRTRLLYDLQEIKRPDLFPKKFNTRKHFTEGRMYDVVSEADSELSKATFVKEQEVVFKKKKYIVSLYKLKIDDEEYLGIAGGYNPLKKSVEPDEDFSGIYWENKYEAAKITAYLKEYIKSLEED